MVSDGNRIVFYSNRGDNWDLWMVNPDGSDLRQLTSVGRADAFLPFWSADGSRLVYTVRSGTPYVIETAKAWREQTPQPVTSPAYPETWFWPRSWSADGRKLAGGWRKNSRSEEGGVAAYSFETRQFEKLTDFGRGGIWLKDSRRVLFHSDGKILLVDSQTRRHQRNPTSYPMSSPSSLSRRTSAGSTTPSKTPRPTSACSASPPE